MHAVGRIAYRGWIDNVQASWVKCGHAGARQILQAGANDLGGTLMDENISRAAGASHGQELDESELRDDRRADRPHARAAHDALRPHVTTVGRRLRPPDPTHAAVRPRRRSCSVASPWDCRYECSRSRMMTSSRSDLRRRARSGNALVDVLTLRVRRRSSTKLGLEPGAMTMVDADRADEIYAEMGPAQRDLGRFGREHHGRRRCRSAAAPRSSAASPTTRSARCSRHDLRSVGVQFAATARDRRFAPTGRCLVIVDARRASARCARSSARARELDPSVRRRLDRRERAGHVPRGLPLGRAAAKHAFRHAADVAHQAGRQVALTLSDPFCVERHRDEFRRARREPHRHPLRERARDHDALRGRRLRRSALAARRGHCEIAALTRGAAGSVVVGGDERHVIARRPGRPSSTRPAPATSTPPGSSTGSRTATTSTTCGAARLARRGRGDLAPRARARRPRWRARPRRRRRLTSALMAAAPPLPHRRPGARPATRPSSSPSSATCNDADLVFELIVSAVRLARDRSRPRRPQDRERRAEGDALRVLRVRAVPLGAQGRDLRFGRARSRTTRSTRRPSRLARELAAADWMVITGAGPGDHGGRYRGRGRDELVRREHPAAVRGRDHPVPRRRPEARQLPLLLHPQGHVREGGDAFVLLPGGFGTLDEAFELLTLVQTGKAQIHADRAARRARRHVLAALAAVRHARAARRAATSRPTTRRCSASPTTRSVALEELTGFYRNYHSLRFVDGDLVLRLQHVPDADLLATAQHRVRRHRRPRQDRAHRGDAASRSPNTTFPSCRACASASTATATRGCAR